MVGKAVGVGNRKVEENSVASAFGGFENLVLLCRVALAYPGVHVHHAGIEPALGAEHGVLLATVTVPVNKAVVVQARAPVGVESGGKLVAVAEVVPVVPALVNESAAAFVSFLVVVVERVEVAHAVAARLEVHAYVHPANAHVGKRVVEPLDKHAHTLRREVAHDIHIVYVAVRRAAVGSMLYVQAHGNVLNRRVAHHGLAPAVDRHSFGHLVPVDYSSVKEIVAARNAYVVVRVFAA